MEVGRRDDDRMHGRPEVNGSQPGERAEEPRGVVPADPGGDRDRVPFAEDRTRGVALPQDREPRGRVEESALLRLQVQQDQRVELSGPVLPKQIGRASCRERVWIPV